MFDLVVCADELGVLSKLPTFVAAALDRIPSVKPEDLDICLLASRVAKLEETVNGHTRCLMDGHGGSGADNKVSTVTVTSPVLPVPALPELGSELASEGWVQVVKKTGSHPAAASGGQPQYGGHSSSVPPPAARRRLNGKNGGSSSTTVKGVPRQLHAFVSRLDKDTSEQDLICLLYTSPSPRDS